MTTLTDAVRSAIQYHFTGVHTAIPATFVSFDETNRSATVQPSINKNYMDGTTARLPVIHKVPVMFPFGGGSSVTFPINEGDYCLLIICERSLEEWKRLGIDEKPIDRRKFNLSDAVAIPGLVPFTETMQPIDGNFSIRYGDSSITITQSGEIQINSGIQIVSVTAGGDINISSNANVSISSIGSLLLNGNSSAELRSNGTAKVNGNLIALGRSGIGGVELLNELLVLVAQIGASLGTLYPPLGVACTNFVTNVTTIKGTL